MPPERPDDAGDGLGWLRQVGALVLTLVALPVVLCGLILRPAWRRGWAQRLGAVDVQPPGTVWLHAASAGEATILARVAERLEDAGHNLYATFTSPNGEAMLRRRRPGLACGLSPLDHPWAVDRALSRIQPAMLVLFETELWPFLIAGAARRRIPVVVLAARVSDDAYLGYRRFRRLIAPTLRRIDLVCARSRGDAERFISLGTPQERVYVTGDLKRIRPVDGQALAPELESFLTDVPLLIGGSTHPGEEAALLAALEASEAAGHRLALVLVPRHTERAADLRRTIEATGRVVHLRSEIAADGTPLAAGEVLVVDTMGELSGLYALASLAFVGGTLVSIGGHNVLEPVQAGSAVCYGPHVENVRDATDFLEANHAGYRVNDASDLTLRVVDLFGDRSVIEAARHAQVLLNANTVSLDRSLSILHGLGLVRSA